MVAAIQVHVTRRHWSCSRAATVLCVAAVALLAATPREAAAQLNKPLHQDGWILAAAHTPGQQGSIWRTDLWFHADTYTSGSITFYFCAANRDNTGVQGHTVTISNGDEPIYIEDVVDTFLDLQGSSWLGAIHYTASVNVQVWARVYSISADGSRSYGQLVEGIPSAHMSPDNSVSMNADDHQWMYAAKHTANGRFRVNVGVVNPTPVAADYWVQIFDAKGQTRPAITSVEVPAFSMLQLSDPFAGVNGGEWHDYQINVTCYTPGGGAFAYLSVVDNATNDAYFVRGVKRLVAENGGGLNETVHQDGWLLAAARTPGKQGSIWRTDLWVCMQNVSPSDFFKMKFRRADQDNTEVQWIDLPLTPGQSVYHVEDVVEEFLQVGSDPWLGAIHYLASSGAQVWARVYSISSDGTASYGQLVEGIPSADMSPPSGFVSSTREYQWMYAAKHTADNRFRVNLGIVNPTAVTCNFGISVFAKNGDVDYSNLELSLPPYSMTQLSDPFAGIDGGEWSEKTIRVSPMTENGGGFAYLSVVDNATNDAFFVRGIKRMPYDGS